MYFVKQLPPPAGLPGRIIAMDYETPDPQGRCGVAYLAGCQRRIQRRGAAIGGHQVHYRADLVARCRRSARSGCSGWIDGQGANKDEKTFLQREAPRREASVWSEKDENDCVYWRKLKGAVEAISGPTRQCIKENAGFLETELNRLLAVSSPRSVSSLVLA